MSPIAFKSIQRMEFSVDVLANTQAYALVISDRMLKFKSDRSKMIVLF